MNVSKWHATRSQIYLQIHQINAKYLTFSIQTIWIDSNLNCYTFRDREISHQLHEMSVLYAVSYGEFFLFRNLTIAFDKMYFLLNCSSTNYSRIIGLNGTWESRFSIEFFPWRLIYGIFKLIGYKKVRILQKMISAKLRLEQNSTGNLLKIERKSSFFF